MPMPDAMTDTILPLYIPVYPLIPRTPLTSTGSSKKFSAMNFARRGSPGIRTVFAKSSIFALLCGVGIFLIIYLIYFRLLLRF